MKIRDLMLGVIIIVVLIMMIQPFGIEWKKGWNSDKEKICIPYHSDGFVGAFENNSHCSEEQNIDKENFGKFYCKNKTFCIGKNDEKMKIIYDDWKNDAKEEKEE